MNTPRTCPALLIAAPASGQGKTTVTAALARLHTRQGRRVRMFKCGPDFLDPFWHELASGAPVHNVDLWLTGEDDIRTRLHAAAAQADLLLIEGVMGLYDGTPSAADIARLLGLPVLLVADASAVAQTFGAVVQGLRGFAPQWDAPAPAPLRWAGVLANRVGSERHAQMLAEAVTASTPPSAATVAQGWLGALPRHTAFSLPERHLGLVAAHELPDALTRLDALADALAATPLGQMDSAALQQHWAVRFTPPAHPPVPRPLLDGHTVAVARDAAFCFIHAANLDTLHQLGARVVFFSPLADAALPACDAVWLPGGYPELHAATLNANTRLRAALQGHVAMGRPIWAECGGMMLLFDQLTDKAGQTHPMWGLLPGHVTMQQRLVALGPQQLRGLGTPALRGHTFHWSLVNTPLKAFARTCGPDASLQPVGQGGEALYVHGPIRASYFHAWFASAPEVIATLLRPQPLRWADTSPPAKGESPEGGRGLVPPKPESPAEKKGISQPKERLPRGPQRIVCLTEETTEWLYRLGREDRIVGISGYTVRPRRARDEKPKVSAFLNAKIDKILALRPDCVLGFSDLQADIAAQLIRAGVQVTVFNQRSVAEIVDVLYQVAALVDALDEGQRQLDEIRHHLHQLEAAAQAADARGLRRPRVWFEEWNDPPISAIRWVSELLTLAGGEDCFPELAQQPLGKHRIVADPSEIIRRNPDIVIGSWCGKKFRPEQVTTRIGWEQVSAVRTQSLYEIKSADILQPGPAALTDGVAQLATLIQAWRQQHG